LYTPTTEGDGRAAARILREQAARCRRLADAVCDAEVERRLLQLALEFEARADAAEAGEG